MSNTIERTSNLYYRCISILDVRGLSYLDLTRSISRLLMPWLLTSPGHQQPWYWPCRSWSYLRMDFKYMCNINVKKWHNCKYLFMFPLTNLARKGLSSLRWLTLPQWIHDALGFGVWWFHGFVFDIIYIWPCYHKYLIPSWTGFMIRLYFGVSSTECLAADKCVIISKYIEYQDMV